MQLRIHISSIIMYNSNDLTPFKNQDNRVIKHYWELKIVRVQELGEIIQTNDFKIEPSSSPKIRFLRTTTKGRIFIEI